MVHIAVYIRTTTQPILSYCDTNDIFQWRESKTQPFFDHWTGGIYAHTLNNLYNRLETYPLSTANNRNNNKLCSIPQ